MEKELVAHIRKLGQHYAYASIKMHEAIAQAAGLSGTDHKYLGFLIVKGEMTAGELATLSGLTTGAVTGLIDRFEKKKLVKRRYAKDDRRKVMVVPNLKNIQRLLEPLFSEFDKQSLALISRFSKNELHIVERFHRATIELMEKTTSHLSHSNERL